MRIVVTGCNHKTAPLAVRERVAFDADAVARALTALVGRYPRTEAMLISTCNRVELYVARAVHGNPQPDEMIAFIAEFHGLPPEQIAPAFYHHRDEQAVGHLLRVAASMDSMVLGETQILGQVRAAAEQARAAATLGPVLDRLARTAVTAAKQVHSQTALSAGRVSVASVAVQFARQIFDTLADKSVLIVGAGKMGEQTLGRLVELGPRQVLVTNRSRPRAEELAARCGGRVLDFADLDGALAQADVVVSSTGSPEPLIDAARIGRVLRARRYRPIFLIDIAVPRDIDPSVGRVEHVYLYNIDDLQGAVEATMTGRAAHVADAQSILTAQGEAFLSWLRARSLAPTIAALRRRLEQLRDEELNWLRPKLTGQPDRDRELIEQFAHRLINKVLHDPASQLKRSSDPDAPALDVFAQALTSLFRLDVQE